jgi:hypothetical protein
MMQEKSLDLLEDVPDPILNLLLDQLGVFLKLLIARLRFLLPLRLVLDACFEHELEF